MPQGPPFILPVFVFYFCKMNSILIAPSLLSADFSNLRMDVEMVNRSEADWLHVDVMDGNFVPNISFGFPVIKSVKKYSSKPLDVHLMISHPENYLKEFADAGADHLSFHIENTADSSATISKIKSLGMKAGIAINPGTDVKALENILHEVYLVILMSVNPGFGGQKFIPETFEKLSALKKLISEKKSYALIEVDGGVTLENAPELIRRGADSLVAGNTVFGSADPKGTISILKNIS